MVAGLATAALSPGRATELQRYWVSTESRHALYMTRTTGAVKGHRHRFRAYRTLPLLRTGGTLERHSDAEVPGEARFPGSVAGVVRQIEARRAEGCQVLEAKADPGPEIL